MENEGKIWLVVLLTPFIIAVPLIWTLDYLGVDRDYQRVPIGVILIFFYGGLLLFVKYTNYIDKPIIIIRKDCLGNTVQKEGKSNG